MSRYTLTVDSSNQKTGGIPVSTSSPDTCPGSCPFMKNGCYGDSGPMRFHWQKVGTGERGVSWAEFCVKVSNLPDGQLWRHNQAGDLPGEIHCGVDLIDREKMSTLILSNNGKRGFTYTHKTEMNSDLATIEMCNESGFTVNMSANNPEHADFLSIGNRAPVLVVLPSWESRKAFKTAQGRTVLMCPAIYSEKTCSDCRWCQDHKRNFIIGVPAHGSDYAKINRACGYVKKLW